MQDGRIEFEIKLSGELSTNLVSEGESETMPDHGVIVAPGVNAQIHQVRGGGEIVGSIRPGFYGIFSICPAGRIPLVVSFLFSLLSVGGNIHE